MKIKRSLPKKPDLILMEKLGSPPVEYAKALSTSQVPTTARVVPTKKEYVPCVGKRCSTQKITSRPPSDQSQWLEVLPGQRRGEDGGDVRFKLKLPDTSLELELLKLTSMCSCVSNVCINSLDLLATKYVSQCFGAVPSLDEAIPQAYTVLRNTNVFCKNHQKCFVNILVDRSPPCLLTLEFLFFIVFLFQLFIFRRVLTYHTVQCTIPCLAYIEIDTELSHLTLSSPSIIVSETTPEKGLSVDL